jgi:molybdopterin-containing oxidoreductase family iron-sulfur binding subunit
MEQNDTNKYWLTLEQWKDDPEFRKQAEKEFQSSPLSEEDSKEGGWARREFLKLMGASLAMGTAGCIRRPVEKIIPYVKAPPEVIQGLVNLYSTSWLDNGQAFGLVIRTREGRPLKVEGNPSHPINQGGTSARAQAHILKLYDPDRLQNPKRNLQNDNKSDRDTINVSWESLDSAVVEQLKKGSVALLSHPLASPSTEALIADFFKAFNGHHVTWSALGGDEVALGQKESFGQEVVPRYRLDRSRLVVTVDGDILGTFLSPTEHMKQWSKVRKVGADMIRVVAFESMLTLTGMNADDRYRIKPSQQLDVVMGLLYEIVAKGGKTALSTDARLKEVLSHYSNVGDAIGIGQAKFAKVAEELWTHRGRSLVVAGGLATRTANSHQLQMAVNLLNSALENDGKTVDYKIAHRTYAGSYRNLAGLIQDMKAGKVKTLIIHGVNPIYSLPADSGFAEGLKKVEMVISTADRLNETATLADYIAADHHAMENWDDLEGQTGIVSIQQPTIRPLYNTRSFQDSLLKWTKGANATPAAAKSADTWYGYLKNRWNTEVYKKTGTAQLSASSFDDFWVALLQEGVYNLTAKTDHNANLPVRHAQATGLTAKPSKTQGYELVLYSTIGLADGSLSNVSWLQEFPDPVSKICWDNYVCVSPEAAAKEHLKEGSKVRLTVNNRTLEVPVHIQPGLHDEVLALAVGYGRESVGRVGNGIGVNAFQLAQFNGGEPLFSGLSTTLEKTGESYKLASIAGHHSMEGRQIVVEATLADVIQDPNAGIHREKIFSIWPKHKYPGHKWAMVIDLNTCTGCSACVTACQSENNVPVVGKKYVLDGREMFWMRIDRYHGGTPENPDTVVQPMLCQQCENAPCETVCPVLATTHSEEGLNDMVYNRCVGTRYCSNNCPYKVRRFNWFNYAKNLTEPQTMALNPEVTVRTRGVMEKCTFCVQRIHEGKNKARDLNQPLKDGDIKTACQSSCPTDAITFGDINNSESQVAKLWEQKRGYGVLEEWNTQPSVRYLARIRNAERTHAPHGGKHETSEGHS